MVKNRVISVSICDLRKNQLKITAKFRASSESYTRKRANFGLKKGLDSRLVVKHRLDRSSLAEPQPSLLDEPACDAPLD